jgi:hypothetical protein
VRSKLVLLGVVCFVAAAGASGASPRSIAPAAGARALQGSDIAVAMNDSADPVTVGSVLTYTVTVANNGPEQAFGGNLVWTLDSYPGTAPAITATPSEGSCDPVAGQPKYNCTFLPGQFSPPGDSVTVTFSFTPKDPGVYSASASATPGDNTDPNATNDSDREDTTVTLQPTLSINDVTVTEGNSGTTNATFTVTKSGPSDTSVDVDYATANGSATASTDYQSTSGTLKFDTNETQKTLTVPILGDTAVEPDETFFVNLSNARNATISDSQGVGTIVNDDAPPAVLSIADAPPVIEGNSGTTSASFTVTRSGTTSTTVTVSYATADGTAAAPGDYQATSGTLTFQPNETQKTVTVLVVGDATFEPNETFSVNLSNPTGATISDAQGVGTITNDDPPPQDPTLSINDVTVAEGNSGTTNATFTVTRAGPTNTTVTVSFATADGTAAAPGDYQATSGTLTFQPNETQKTVVVPVVGDTAVEANETFFVNLSSPTGATISDAQGVGTITNDDAPPGAATLAVNDVTVAEGNSGTTSATFTVTRAVTTTTTVTVSYATADGTATAPGDYQATSGTLTFQPNETQKTVTVAVVGDTAVEANETFLVNLSNASGATISDAQGVGTITNDDQAQPEIVDFEPRRDPPADLDRLMLAVDGKGTVTGGPAGAARTSAAAAQKPGTIRCGAKGVECISAVAPGTSVALKARAGTGYRFAGWKGACRGQDSTCTVNPGNLTSVEALFRPTSARRVTATLRAPRQLPVRWAASVGSGTLVLSGRVSAEAVLKLRLRRRGQGPLVTWNFRTTGQFNRRLRIRGTIRRRAKLFPGEYVATLSGRAGRMGVPLQVRAIYVPPPPEGVVRTAKVSDSRTGTERVRLAAGVRQAWAIFRFNTQPRAEPIVAEWRDPNGNLIGRDEKNNRPVIRTGIGSDSALPSGRYVVELTAGGRVVYRLSVRVGV